MCPLGITDGTKEMMSTRRDAALPQPGGISAGVWAKSCRPLLLELQLNFHAGESLCGCVFGGGEVPGAGVGEVCPQCHRYPPPSRGSAVVPLHPHSLSPIFTQPPGYHPLLVVPLPQQLLSLSLSVLVLSHLLNFELLESCRPQSLDLFSFYPYAHP